jgi:hypothetical protein
MNLQDLQEELVKQDQANFNVKQQLIRQGEDLELPPETWRNVFEQAAG